MSAFPISLVKHLAIMDLVKLSRVCLTTAIKKNCLEHVLADLVEELDEEDLPRIKTQLDRVEGITRSIIDKRIKWETWPTGPVADLTKVGMSEDDKLAALYKERAELQEENEMLRNDLRKAREHNG